MTVFLECAGPFQWRPGFYKSRSIYRVWWGWFAVGALRISFHEFATTAFDWSYRANHSVIPAPAKPPNPAVIA